MFSGGSLKIIPLGVERKTTGRILAAALRRVTETGKGGGLFAVGVSKQKMEE